MRNPFRFQAGALLLAILMLAGPVQAQDQNPDQQDKASVESIQREMQDLKQELAEYSADRREQLAADIEATLKDIDTRIEILETRIQEDWQEMDKVARAEARSALASARRERARVADWYQRMQDSSEFTWESMKEGFNDAFDQLSKAWQDAEEDVQKAMEKE